MSLIRLSDGPSKNGYLVVGLAHSATSRKELHVEAATAQLDQKSLLASLKAMNATGRPNEVIKIPDTTFGLIIFTGLGVEKNNYDHEVLRRAAGAASRALAGSAGATFSLPAFTLEEIAAVAEGAALGAYSFTDFRGTTKSDFKPTLGKITISTPLANRSEVKTSAHRAEVIAQYTHIVRDLINTPPSHLTPESFCKKFTALVKDAGGSAAGLKVTILDAKALKSAGYGGITAVGQGSSNPPRLLQISYQPKKSKKKVAFVGKGITFDTGGLALKPALGMEAMKSDMSGAAAVCAAVLAIATLKIPVTIEAWAPLAENMVSDTATRPSDIITMFGGKTVEVLNPDAEGRLVLGDALVKAQMSESLDAIIDVATLTGAQVVALGTRTSAVMTNNQELSDLFVEASTESGEAFWPMPLPEELRASLDSPVADLANIGERMGGMLVAGLFLKDFIKPELPWLHLDIAGPSFNEGAPHGYTPVGGTGIALRSLVRLVEKLQFVK